MFEKWISEHSGIPIIKDCETSSWKNIKQLEYLEKISSSERIWISDFNPILLELDLETGMKLFGLDRFKEIYRNFFRVISGEIVQKFSWAMPIFDQIIFIETSKLKELDKRNKNYNSENSTENNSNNTGVYQYILEWELKNDLDEEDFINLLKFLNKQWFDLNLNSDSKAKPKNFNHPIRTLEWTLEYRWHFENSWIGFLWDSLISIQNPETKEKRLRLTLNYFWQDIYIFLICSNITLYKN